MVGQGVFFAGDPIAGEEQEVQERPKEGGVWSLVASATSATPATPVRPKT